MSYRIKRVAHITGINPATLRAWERRYNLIAPGRTDSGYRLYSDDDVAMLSRIKQLTDEGLTIGEAIARVRRAWAPLGANAGGAELGEVRQQLRDALLAMDRQGALTAYERAAYLSPERRTEEVLLPVMREIGDLWQNERAVIVQEHFASAFVREKLAQMMAELDTGMAPGPEAILVGTAGDAHELGLMGCAVRLASAGWRVLYLGTNVPVDELRRVVRDRRPALLCTSMVLRRDPRAFRETVEALRQIAPRDTSVVVGGAGIPEMAEPVPGVRYAHTLADIFTAN